MLAVLQLRGCKWVFAEGGIVFCLMGAIPEEVLNSDRLGRTSQRPDSMKTRISP